VSVEDAASGLVQLGSDVVVEGPPALRETVAERVHAMAALYEDEKPD